MSDYQDPEVKATAKVTFLHEENARLRALLKQLQGRSPNLTELPPTPQNESGLSQEPLVQEQVPTPPSRVGSPIPTPSFDFQPPPPPPLEEPLQPDITTMDKMVLEGFGNISELDNISLRTPDPPVLTELRGTSELVEESLRTPEAPAGDSEENPIVSFFVVVLVVDDV